MIRLLIQLYILILIVNAFLSYVPSLRSQDWAAQINKVSELTCRYVRHHNAKRFTF